MKILDKAQEQAFENWIAATATSKQAVVKQAVVNACGLEPLGRAVLVEHDSPQGGGLIELPPDVENRMLAVEQRAKIVAIGSEAWKEETKPRARVGDIVLISRFGGHMAKGPLDGKPYRLINDRDVFARIVEARHVN